MARIFCWRIAAGLLLATGLALIAGTVTGEEAIVKNPPAVDMVQLPRPDFDGGMTLDQALLNRRSQRNFSERPLTLDQVGRILWAAQGVTSDRGFRTAPSAGALFPLEVYLVSGRTQDLAAGIYHYLPGAHQLRPVKSGDYRSDLARAALSQKSVATAAVSIVITDVSKRTTVKYGERGEQYILIETGHAAQNILLEAQALGLGAVPVGAFEQSRVHRLLGLSEGEQPLYIIPVGHPAE